MKLNTIDVAGWVFPGKDMVEFSLMNTTVPAAAALDGQTLQVFDDNGEDVVASFAGYEVTGVWESGDAVRLRVSRELSTEVSDVVEAVEKNFEALNATVTQKLADVDENVGTMNAAVTEAQNAAKAAQNAAENAAAKAAQNAAESAQNAAENAKTDPAVISAATMYVNAIELTNSEIADVRDLIKDFVAGEEYKKGWIRRYDGKYYRMAQDINSTTSTTYQPGTGTESLYTLIDLAPDGIRIWHTVTHAEDSFTLGELCHYPDAEGPIYVSKRVGNTSVPGTDQWWVLRDA